ncbi:hypothetical protein L9G74_03160 [Shewanella sp. C32]|uniref:Uncharacterized protein n=1 Tax=Shewanella electrica TaxID=515560 RepID=A0ABT2FGI8_9GAMM|nr:hypothetical protein [Shewanella electrica]MCH1923330.1 hypothetical protein [Shewanella electrica]MCS4555427.1 hypothetical protein [Shewanella electrica]
MDKPKSKHLQSDVGDENKRPLEGQNLSGPRPLSAQEIDELRKDMKDAYAKMVEVLKNRHKSKYILR